MSAPGDYGGKTTIAASKIGRIDGLIEDLTETLARLEKLASRLEVTANRLNIGGGPPVADPRQQPSPGKDAPSVVRLESVAHRLRNLSDYIGHEVERLEEL